MVGTTIMRSPDFWSWFDGIAGPQLAHRTEGFRKVFDHLDRTQPVSTIPTGRSNTSSFDAGDQFGLTPTSAEANTPSSRGTESSLTLRWREMDSNFWAQHGGG